MHLAYDDALRSRISRDRLREAVDATRPRLQFAGHWHQRSIFELDRHDGGDPTRVHVLNMDGQAGNWVVLDLETLAVLDPYGSR